MVVWAIAMFLFTASFAGAEGGDTSIKVIVPTTVTSTGGSSQSDQTQGQSTDVGVQQGQSQSNYSPSSAASSSSSFLKDSGNSSAEVNTPRPFLAAPGFVSGIVQGTVENNQEWNSFCFSREAFSADKIHRMERKGRFGDIFAARKVHVTDIEAPRMASASLTCQMEWPAGFDGVSAEVRVSGDTNSTEAEAVGTAMAVCVEKGWSAIAILVSKKIEGSTRGLAVGLSTAVSSVTDSTGVAHAAGGMIGTINTRNNDYEIVRAKCLTGITTSQVRRVVEEKTVVAAQSSCDITENVRLISEAEAQIAVCYWYGYNNLFYQNQAGENSLKAYRCTGDVAYLNAALRHYGMGELNYINGSDIKNHADSNSIIAEVEYGLASAIYARDGVTDDFYRIPTVVVHQDKKTGRDKPIALTAGEQQKIKPLRENTEKYSKSYRRN